MSLAEPQMQPLEVQYCAQIAIAETIPDRSCRSLKGNFTVLIAGICIIFKYVLFS